MFLLRFKRGSDLPFQKPRSHFAWEPISECTGHVTGAPPKMLGASNQLFRVTVLLFVFSCCILLLEDKQYVKYFLNVCFYQAIVFAMGIIRNQGWKNQQCLQAACCMGEVKIFEWVHPRTKGEGSARQSFHLNVVQVFKCSRKYKTLLTD